MPTVKLPLFTRTIKNVDGSVLSNQAFKQYNGYIDELGGLNVRPGLANGISTGARECDGLYFWEDKHLVSVESGKVYFYSTVSGSIERTVTGGTVSFSSGVPVSFASDGTYLFMAGGGKINYVNSVGTVAEITDTDAPTTVTHIAFMDGYILAISGKKLYWSNIPTTTAWSALDFATAEGAPDNLLSLVVSQRQIYLIGSESTEIWENDGESPFARVPGGFIEMGTLAKYSPVKLDNSLVWLGSKKYFVEFAGGDIKRLSTPFDKELQAFSKVDDCIGGRFDEGGKTFCVFNFPTERRTLVYNVIEDEWADWAHWDADAEEWWELDFRCSAFDTTSGRTYVGSPRARAICLLNKDSRTDLTGSGTNPVKFLKETGWIDHGTSKRKRNSEIRIRARRGDESSLSNPKLMIRYLNDGQQDWSSIQEIDLGATGDTDIHRRLLRKGVYRSRKYEISATDAVSIVLSDAEEDFEVLQS